MVASDCAAFAQLRDFIRRTTDIAKDRFGMGALVGDAVRDGCRSAGKDDRLSNEAGHAAARILDGLGYPEMADLRIDTSYTAVHELRDLVRNRIALRPAAAMSLQLISFGYKHGTPRDADFVFDVRCLPNPHWDKELRKFSGLEPPVAEFLLGQDDVVRMVEDLKRFCDTWIPRFEADNRSYLCVAVGCTGGYHRSVFVVEQLAAHLRAGGRNVMVKHRDL